MSQAQPSRASTRTYSLKDELREVGYKIFSHSTVNAVLDLVEPGLFVIPYRDTKKPALKNWRDLQNAEFSVDNVIKAWERASVQNTDYYGVLLGRPSNYLILIDIDSEDATRLQEDGRAGEARKLVEQLYEEVKERLPRIRDPDLNIDVLPAALTRTRRGVHVLVRLSRNDYGKLAESIGKANAELSEAELAGQKVKIELRLRGATPLETNTHTTEFYQLPLPAVSLQYLAKAVEALGARLPVSGPEANQTTSEPNRTFAGEGGEGYQHVQIHMGTHEESTLSPTVTSKDSTRETLPPVASGKLSEQDIARIVDLLKAYWVKGHRNNIELALIGWLIKRGVPEEQAEELVRRLAEAAGDEEARKRLDEVRRQYRVIETGEKKVEELLGKAGLLRELQQVIKEQNPGISEEEARDRALTVVSELEKILGPRRSRIVRIQYRTGWYFVNDPERGILLVKEKMDENGQVRRTREYISDWYIARGVVVRGDGQYVYKLLFANARTRERWVLAGQLDEIARELKRVHGVRRSQVLYDAVSSVVQELIRRGIIKRRKTAAVAGILPYKDTVKLVRAGALSRLLIPKEPSLEKARQALQLLVELRRHYDPKKFDVAINWAAYAPASYALKKLFHVKQVYLLLHGEKQTGKTTLARIITAMFPVVTAEEEEIPEEGQSEYRLAWKLNIAAVPMLEDEVQGISRKPSLLGLLKRAASGDLVRWRGDQNRKYHARAPLVFTSNFNELITDPALVERIISTEFTQADYVYKKSREEREEFRRLYTEYRAAAHHLGAVLLQVVVEHWQDIANHWAHRLQEKRDYLELGQQIWRWVAERLGAEPPEWAGATLEVIEERPESTIEEIFWEVLEDAVRQAMLKAGVQEDDSNLGLWGMLNRLAQLNLLPSWLKVKFAEVVVLHGVMPELEKRGVDVPSLKRLADILGFEYKKVRVGNRVTKAMIVPKQYLVDRLANNLTPHEEQEIVQKVLNKVLAGELSEYEIESYLVDNGLKPRQAAEIADKVRAQLAARAHTQAGTAPA